MKTATINARVKSELKHEVEIILAQLGISTTQAISLFFEQIQLTKGLPFELKIPNDETIAAMKDARINRNLENINLEQLKTQIQQ